jgi:hypothetical protein
LKLLGRDIRSDELLEKVQARLQARGLWPEPARSASESGVEPRVDPRGFNLHALEEHADPTRPLPLHTHRGGLGQAVLLAKWAFRKSCQVLINEALARQRVFNGHVRDSYAQLSAEVARLRAQVEALEAAASKAAGPALPAPESAPPEASRPARRPARSNPAKTGKKTRAAPAGAATPAVEPGAPASAGAARKKRGARRPGTGPAGR